MLRLNRSSQDAEKIGPPWSAKNDRAKIEKREKEEKEDIWIQNHKDLLIMNNYGIGKRERRYIHPSLQG